MSMEGGKTANPVPAYRKRMGYQAGLLGGMALLSSVALVATDITTKGEIELRLAEDLQASLSEVLPPRVHDNDLLTGQIELNPAEAEAGDPDMIYRATWEDRGTGVAFSMSEPGYSGDITVIMGVAANGELLGVRVVSHKETPGLGDKIEAGKSPWISEFTGLSFANLMPDQWGVKKDGGHFDQFSGATITPRAVVKTVKRGLEFFARRKDELLGKFPLLEIPNRAAKPTSSDTASPDAEAKPS
ncbi:MAG: electron transport complex subunit RsxG [Gammaproteobacteria bacterium]